MGLWGLILFFQLRLEEKNNAKVSKIIHMKYYMVYLMKLLFQEICSPNILTQYNSSICTFLNFEM